MAMTAGFPDELQTAIGPSYSLERELTGGAMSRVFVATETALGRKVVVKVLPPELAATVSVERFRREIQLSAQLRHPHIVPVLAAGESDGLLFYTMPFVSGESLRQRLEREQMIPAGEAVRLTREVSDALAFAHEQGIVHRDIKPENILLDAGHAVVTDFGIARAIGQGSAPTLTQTGMGVGTPRYMSPEQLMASSDVDGRSDIYSLGCVLYEMLVGQAPGYDEIVSGKIAVNPTLGRLQSVISRALSTDPAARFQSAREFTAALEVATRPGGHERRWLVGAGVAAVIVVASAGAYLSRGKPATDPPHEEQITFTGDALLQGLSPDGNVLALVSLEGWVLSFQDLKTGNLQRFGDSILDMRWIPRSDDLLIQRFSGGWVRVSKNGGALRPVIDTAEHAFAPSFDTAGVYVAYLAPSKADTKTQWNRIRTRRVSDPSDSHDFTLPFNASTLEWSPGGEWLVVSGALGAADTPDGILCLVSAIDGHTVELRRWNNYPEKVWAIRWADPDMLYYTQGFSPSVLMAQRVDRNSGRPKGPPQELFRGTWRAFAVHASGTDLYVNRTDGSSKILIGTVSPDARVEQSLPASRGTVYLALSPDGGILAAVERRNGASDLYLIDVTTRAKRQITNLQATNAGVPVWAPDGRQIAFAAHLAGRPPRIFVADVAGSARELGSAPIFLWGQLTWAGNGLVYTSLDTAKNVAIGVHRFDIARNTDSLLHQFPQSLPPFVAVHPNKDATKLAYERNDSLRVVTLRTGTVATRFVPSGLQLHRWKDEQLLLSKSSKSAAGTYDREVFSLSPSSGAIIPLWRIPCSDALNADVTRFACLAGTSSSDVWRTTIPRPR
jgi:tRNA A-37 threonylcarbamoyl transferase component Bud32/dipeptidyl aminopeptidase/acylaminoacyl peptidase